MIDQQLPPVPNPPHLERRRHRWRLVGLKALGVVGALSAAAVGLALLVFAAVFAGSLLLGGGGPQTGEERPRRASAPLQERATPPTGHDAVGAAAAAGAFTDAYEHACRTGDYAPYEALQAPTCTMCGLAVLPVQKEQARGVDLGDPGMGTPSIVVSAIDDDAAQVHTSVDVSAAVVTLNDGTEAPTPAYRAETDVRLVWADDRWQVADLRGDGWFTVLTPVSPTP